MYIEQGHLYYPVEYRKYALLEHSRALLADAVGDRFDLSFHSFHTHRQSRSCWLELHPFGMTDSTLPGDALDAERAIDEHMLRLLLSTPAYKLQVVQDEDLIECMIEHGILNANNLSRAPQSHQAQWRKSPRELYPVQPGEDGYAVPQYTRYLYSDLDIEDFFGLPDQVELLACCCAAMSNVDHWTYKGPMDAQDWLMRSELDQQQLVERVRFEYKRDPAGLTRSSEQKRLVDAMINIGILDLSFLPWGLERVGLAAVMELGDRDRDIRISIDLGL